MRGPRRHHHLSQGVLRNFLEDGETKLWWYSRADNRYEQRTPRGIAHARNTYTFPSIEGEQRYILEEALAKVESLAVPALRKLEAREEITQAERNAICELIGFQFTRTPTKIGVLAKVLDIGGNHSIQVLADRIERMTAEEYAAYLVDFNEHATDPSNMEQAELVEQIRTNPPRLISTREGTLRSMVEAGTEITLRFSQREWVVVHAPRESAFVTSDEGVFVAPGPNADSQSDGPLSRGVSAIFPFSRKAALLVTDHEPPAIRHARADRSTVRSINDGLGEVSSELYGHSRPLIESIVKRNKLASTTVESLVDEKALQQIMSDLMADPD